DAEHVGERGRPGEDPVPRLSGREVLTRQLQSLDGAIGLGGLERLDLHDTQVLQCGQHVLDELAPAHHGDLVHLRDHGSTFSITNSTASPWLARAWAISASAALLAALTTLSL